MSENRTLVEVIAEKGITMKVRYGAPANENFRDADGWTVTLRYQGRQMTVPFYMGRGHNGAEPKVDDVLDCLLSDATSVDNARSFEDWANELGYDSDSRTAERVFKACERASKRLHTLLGDDFDDFAEAER